MPKVLNAFRHQRTVHRCRHNPSTHRESVLNAFRHQRTVHSHDGSQAIHAIPSAQRLSASTNCSPPVVSLVFVTTSRAQRLSASTNCSPANHIDGIKFDDWCSTPFGINELFTEGPSAYGLLHTVLNAFRHQRTVHTREATALLVVGHVLNAFRHQRTVHSVNAVWNRWGVWCSTPFGINELFTCWHG